MKFSRVIGKTKLFFIKHAPEILIGTGVIGTVASTVMAVKATPKAQERILEMHEEVETMTDKKEIAKTKVKCYIGVAKDYAPAAIVEGASVTCILAGTGKFKKRNAALASSCAAIDGAFKEYRDRVAERFGSEVESEIRHNVKKETIEIDENGEKKTVEVNSLQNYSEFAKFYQAGCTGWTKDPEQNLWELKKFESWCNDKLRDQGYLFLNEVYDMLGLPRTKGGQIYGWIYEENNEHGDNVVDFGIYKATDKTMDFVNGYENVILLDFNVDGNILDRI